MSKMVSISATELARLQAAAAATSDRPVKVEPREGVSQKTGKPYKGFRITGPFPPVYLSDGAFRAIVANADVLKGALD